MTFQNSYLIKINIILYVSRNFIIGNISSLHMHTDARIHTHTHTHTHTHKLKLLSNMKNFLIHEKTKFVNKCI